MVNKLFFYITKNTMPYENLALEEHLMESVPENAVTLYLWQNKHTVVVGRNQNPWRECNVTKLEEDGGYFVRRLSGGGAVFHDMGNLNFTFLVRKQNYDIDLQLEVILRAVRSFGIAAEKTGRNDITVAGRKFSGNAFYKSGGFCYHHGTIMLSANLQSLSKYLNVSTEKLKSKGVASVRARVLNLAELAPELTVTKLQKALLAAFAQVYGSAPIAVNAGEIDTARVGQLTEKFASWGWNFGSKIDFSYELSRRFEWGEIQLQLAVKDGKVNDVAVFSDAMNADIIGQLSALFRGSCFAAKALCSSLNPLLLQAEGDGERQIILDIQRLLQEDLA